MIPPNELIQQGIRKALKTRCHSKVAVICFDKRAKFLGIAVNYQRFSHKGGGVHAEISALNKFGKKLKTIVLLRSGLSGILRPINCCDACKKVLTEHNIKIVTIQGIPDDRL
jgi:cytidine deaminase